MQYEEIKNIEAVLNVVLKFVEICRENNVGNKLLLQIFSSSDVDQKKKKLLAIPKSIPVYMQKNLQVEKVWFNKDVGNKL